MSRIDPVTPERMSDEQRRLYDSISSGPRGGVRGPLAIWLHRPGLAAPAQELGAYCRYGSSLDARLSELAIITLGSLWDAGYEWSAHKPLALAAGVAPEVVDAIGRKETPRFEREDEQLVYDFVTALSVGRDVTEPLFRRVLEGLGRDGLIDLTGIVGYYTFISMTIKVFDIQPGPRP
ncbi:carboxymuconolactone decarboxylase family protein [Paraburkholderia caballeronis]|uniref:4-carboxymuconolactone decarboxylase n=1 Tax=Paraburkholderia caballeronis TaxID=416943 RepID=A0A1H7G0Q9_9BURK|nr:carboxymuconolactone decarboxylase family protein [Paraburkholderia caballeronis]PXW24820.1 4-carboxymuconolactone decarboxylase [Paraburkholderia caballeronis]PXX00550.1 4-carboxymuconolactone decarboxylase [Paraburkholderia caballeronis]RAJ98613.1 4-carboxymuconolactone decarboxylase [Paraburkholderia caballeronis]SEE68178.1 4-carboxymuconolactone decarboxylase [Paraburkholderia caballeronis]SEK30030.1 4-carboxymuconolactone decarboxylase [Paraburkholderia caballeronis]